VATAEELGVAVPCEILLVRHAVPHPDGTLDPGLGDEGRAQSASLVEYLAPEEIEAIYSSHLKRAVQTVEPLAAQRDVAIVIDEGLREWVSNAKAYMGTEGMVDNARTKAFLEGRYEEEFMPPHNADELRATMLATLRRIGLAHQGQKVVAASHGGASNTFLAAVLDSPRRFFFNPGYASISRVQVWPDGRFVLLCINELTHPRDRGMGLLPIG
jgi:2,3-bisphosphoglycerate-dependent phosphoglycerate mutase